MLVMQNTQLCIVWCRSKIMVENRPSWMSGPQRTFENRVWITWRKGRCRQRQRYDERSLL